MKTTISIQQKGVTLLEVLVAIVVLSFGLLGMLGLAANGMKMTSSSHYRTVAAEQLRAMADMMNANPNLAYNYANLTSTSNSDCLTTTGCGRSSGVTDRSDTSYASIPNNDYYMWRTNLGLLLPSGNGIVCLDASPGDGNSGAWACSGTGRLTVKVCWNENARVAVSGGGTSGSDSSTDSCISTQI